MPPSPTTKRGFRVAWASGYQEGGEAPLQPGDGPGHARQYLFRQDLNTADFQRELDRHLKDGYLLEQISGYPVAGETRYIGVWSRETTLATSGKEVPQLAAFDEAMVKFMRERGIRCGTLAVMKDGRIRAGRRGYGHAPRDGSRKVDPETPFRLGSLTKAITRAAVLELVRAGKLSLDTPVFKYLGVEPPPGRTADPRLKDVTLRHLIDRQGRVGLHGRPDLRPDVPASDDRRSAAQEQPGQPVRDILRDMAGQPSQFDPGTKFSYSNFGYCVLGRVIEKASGQNYTKYVRESLLAPLGIRTIDLALHRQVLRRHPLEPEYIDPGSGANVMTGKGFTAAPDGTFYLEAMDASGGLIGSAPDMARFLQAYWMNG